MGLFLLVLLTICILENVSLFKVHKNVFQRSPSRLCMSTPKRTPVRVRFAPSPTGSLHVGGARTALFNWLVAKKTNGSFIVRVEDTDEARSTRASENAILSDLKWLNMDWDEGPITGGPHGPYRQSERKPIYHKIAQKLIEKGHAYYCFCTKEELDQKRSAAEIAGVDGAYDKTWRNADPIEVQKKLKEGVPYTVRFKVPKGKVVILKDLIRGRVIWDADKCLSDFILLRSNGMPVYNFCVSVDDMDMRISHVIRAEEHLPNTLRQLLIMEAMEHKPPIYAHCSLILGADRSKLSKRHGATSVSQFCDQGFLPKAIVNYLATLGWNEKPQKNIYTTEVLIAAFDLSQVKHGASMFDRAKLRWLNGKYIRAMSLVELQPYVLRQLGREASVINSKTNETTHYPRILQDSVTQEDLASQPQALQAFVDLATNMSHVRVKMLSEGNLLIAQCLGMDLEGTLEADPQAEEVLLDGLCLRVAVALKRDLLLGSKVFPTGVEGNTEEMWNVYVKRLATELGVEVAGPLLRALRLCLTGSLRSPSFTEHLQLVGLASTPEVRSKLDPDLKIVPFIDRVECVQKSSWAMQTSAAAQLRE